MRHICQCKKVTEKEILEVESDDYYEVQRVTQAGRGCGSCAPLIIAIIAHVA